MKMEKYIEFAFAQFSSKTGRQKYSAWMHGYPTPNCLRRMKSLSREKYRCSELLC